MGRGHRLSPDIIAKGISRAVNELHHLARTLSVERLVFASLNEKDVDEVRGLIEDALQL